MEWGMMHAQLALWRDDALQAHGSPTRPATIDDLWDEAWKTEESISKHHALRLYVRFLGRWPDHAGANLRLGALLAEQDQPAADAHLSMACRSDPEVIADALVVRGRLARRKGAAEEAAKVHMRWLENLSALERFAEARDDVDHSATSVQPHGFNRARIDRLGERLTHFEKLTVAYLVRREFEEFPDAIVYLLTVETSFGIGGLDEHALDAIAVGAGLAFPITVREHSNLPRRLRNRIEAADGSLIYEYKRHP